jgi:hypothetical protein
LKEEWKCPQCGGNSAKLEVVVSSVVTEYSVVEEDRSLFMDNDSAMVISENPDYDLYCACGHKYSIKWGEDQYEIASIYDAGEKIWPVEDADNQLR